MKILDLALNGVIVLSAAVFLAYVGYIYFDFGLFKTLPANISEFFLANGALQYVAIAIAIAAIIAKRPVGRAVERAEAEARS